MSVAIERVACRLRHQGRWNVEMADLDILAPSPVRSFGTRHQCRDAAADTILLPGAG